MFNLPRREVDADRALGVVVELVAREPTQQARLAHARVALRVAGAAGQACAASTRAKV